MEYPVLTEAGGPPRPHGPQPATLAFASRRIALYRPETCRRNVLALIDLDRGELERRFRDVSVEVAGCAAPFSARTRGPVRPGQAC